MKNNRMMPLIAAGLFSILATFLPAMGIAQPPPPPLPGIDFPGPPAVVVIPGSNIYFSPDVNADLLFYHGYWYRPYEGRWYRGPNYNGPWGFVPPNRVPRPLINLPHDYRRVPPGQERIPHGQLKNNWRSWEREKHWDKREERGKGPGQVQMQGKGKERGKGPGQELGKKDKKREKGPGKEQGKDKGQDDRQEQGRGPNR